MKLRQKKKDLLIFKLNIYLNLANYLCIYMLCFLGAKPGLPKSRNYRQKHNKNTRATC